MRLERGRNPALGAQEWSNQTACSIFQIRNMAGGLPTIHESHLVISEPITGLYYTKQTLTLVRGGCVCVCGDTDTKLQHARRGASPSHIESHPENKKENKKGTHLCMQVV